MWFKTSVTNRLMEVLFISLSIALENNTSGLAMNCRQCLVNLWLTVCVRRLLQVIVGSSVDWRRIHTLLVLKYCFWAVFQSRGSVWWFGDSLYASEDYYRSLSGRLWIALRSLVLLAMKWWQLMIGDTQCRETVLISHKTIALTS